LLPKTHKIYDEIQMNINLIEVAPRKVGAITSKK